MSALRRQFYRGRDFFSSGGHRSRCFGQTDLMTVLRGGAASNTELAASFAARMSACMAGSCNLAKGWSLTLLT